MLRPWRVECCCTTRPKLKSRYILLCSACLPSRPSSKERTNLQHFPRDPRHVPQQPLNHCRMLLRCFSVMKLTSRNRSTQLARQVCSVLSSAPLLTVPVTHFFQQMSVRTCVSATGGQGQKGEASSRENKGRGLSGSRSLTRVRWFSLPTNCRSSALSFSLSCSRSSWETEGSIAVLWWVARVMLRTGK